MVVNELKKHQIEAIRFSKIDGQIYYVVYFPRDKFYFTCVQWGVNKLTGSFHIVWDSTMKLNEIKFGF